MAGGSEVDRPEGAFAILAPDGHDADVIGEHCDRLHLSWASKTTARELCEEYSSATLAWVVTEESLQSSVEVLAHCLQTQPAWSDLPVVILTASRTDESAKRHREKIFDRLGHVTLLQRPLRSETLLRALDAARRTRIRQYCLRDEMVALKEAAKLLEVRVASRTQELTDEIEKRRQAESSLVKAQRFEAIGQLTGGVAHDFNNLLQVIASSASVIERAGENQSLRKRAVDSILRTVARGSSLTQQLLAYVSKQPVAGEELDLGEHLIALEAFFSPALRGDIRFELHVSPDLHNVHTDSGQLDSALLNIAVNARDAMPKGGVFSITAFNEVVQEEDRTGLQPGRYVAIELKDSGNGMDELTLSKAFEPFFTTKKVGGGTGLGLSQVYGFAKQSGGDVAIDSTPGIGTSIKLRIPAAFSGNETQRKQKRDEVGEQVSWSKVLVVEDDESVAETTCQLLHSIGFETVLARSADEAIQLSLAGIDFVISDVIMPGLLDGIALAKALRRRMPTLPILLVSGYVGSPERMVGSELQLLSKPYTKQQLLDAIRRLPRAEVA